jgi:hypothetical protein
MTGNKVIFVVILINFHPPGPDLDPAFYSNPDLGEPINADPIHADS